MARVQNIDNLFKLVIFHLLTRLLAAHVVGQEVFRFRTGFASDLSHAIPNLRSMKD